MGLVIPRMQLLGRERNYIFSVEILVCRVTANLKANSRVKASMNFSKHSCSSMLIFIFFSLFLGKYLILICCWICMFSSGYLHCDRFSSSAYFWSCWDGILSYAESGSAHPQCKVSYFLLEDSRKKEQMVNFWAKYKWTVSSKQSEEIQHHPALNGW